MKILFLQWIFLFSSLASFGQQPVYSLFLIGDTGEDTTASPALVLMKDELQKCGVKSGVIFLGDNVYPQGIDNKNGVCVKKLSAQLALLSDHPGYVCFIPGNHDWKAQKRGGLEALRLQEELVSSLRKNTDGAPAFQPKVGYPGVESHSPAPGLRLVFVDTQWFLQHFNVETNGSRKQTAARCYRHLDSVLAMAKGNNEQVVITAHHPLFTNGDHSRVRQPLRFLVNCTPLQLLGLAGLNRWLSQDLAQPRYKRMRRQLLNVINKYDNVVYASGHEHNLQYFKDGSRRYIVSGSGSKITKLRKRKKFKQEFEDDAKTGFVKLEYLGENKIRVIVHRVGEEPLLLESR